ncbi:hypothetical protein SteCoe_13470 [Stentor coeruleus]|uniref:MORN repeat-containing protein 5 n=1 Tax=Stentor coeruleus TaxID=5963 RepID=A0A1R2C888_9CILI|nr:hypothetical protein SteCoe_13470 [Stentor coeruleus]
MSIQKVSAKNIPYIGPKEQGKNHGIGILYLKSIPHLIEFSYGIPQRLLKIPQTFYTNKHSDNLTLLHFAYPYWENPDFSEENGKAYHNKDSFNEIFIAVIYEKKLLFNGRLFNQKKICIDYEENDDEIYIGEFTKGIRNGFGLLIKKEFKYEGEFTNGKPNGNGIIYDGFIGVNNFWIQGDMKNGKFNGFGQIIFQDGQRYIGEIENNMYKGFGVYYYDDARIYLGEFYCNKKQGKGTFYFNGKVEYEGEWKNDEIARSDGKIST